MVVTGTASPAEAADRVVGAVLSGLQHGSDQGIVVDSPPGAGKSTLVVRVAGELAAAGEPAILIAQTNEQVDDLINRLAATGAHRQIGRLSAVDYVPSPRVAQHQVVTVGTRVRDLDGSTVIVGTAAKWATVPEGTWPWAIVDEGYQMRSDALLRVANRFQRALFVGDPGQLDPFSTVESERWVGLTWDPMQSAMAVVLRHNPGLPLHRLPVSWRLPASAVPAVARAFYPFTGFRSGTGSTARRIALEAQRSAARSAHDMARSALDNVARSALDDAVELAASRGWALYELPARHTVRTDPEAIAACAALATRLLDRRAVAYSESAPSGRPVSPDRIAIGVAHRDQAAAIRALLPPSAAAVTVDTANRLQGREYDVTIVLHPLSGRRDATAFHLETGRLCVLASRHRHACIVVARAGIQELLDAHPGNTAVHLNVPVTFPDGWEANHAMLAHLERYRVIAG
ncbi:MAG: ATP-binding protein [Micromonosporaceae bacterium]|nr:ATP-binding protein [Micromonosporaceae bacterium]